jgi:hypothetical protein
MVYLCTVEEDEGLHLGNVYASGGQDTKMKEAEANALTLFRSARGEPAGGNAYAWNCPCDTNATGVCTSFNLKKSHPPSSIVNGKCKYRHVCDKFVIGDDGKRTKCGATDHCRADCTNPKRVDA